MKFGLLLGIALYVGCTALLLAQNEQSATDRKAEPPTEKPDEKRPNQPSSETKHGPIDALSDTGGADVLPYLDRMLSLLKASWYKRIPESSNMEKGKVTIKFHILKNGQAFSDSGNICTGQPSVHKHHALKKRRPHVFRTF